MEIPALVIFAGTLAVAAGSPGPSIAALVARMLSSGHRDVLPFLAAMWIGEAIWLSLAVWGLSAVAQSFHLLFAVIKWAGVIYLLVLAWNMWSAPTDPGEGGVPTRTSPRKMFGAGLAVTLGNPKIMMFYVAPVPTIIDLAQLSLVGWAELTATMVLVLMAVDIAWVVLATRARRLLKSQRAIGVSNRLSAGAMVGAANAIATR